MPHQYQESHHQISRPRGAIVDDEEVRDALGAVLLKLDRLERGQAEIRDQLAGRTKSHSTVAEVAQLMGRSDYTVRGWIKDGLIEAIRVKGTGPRGRLLVPREEIAKLF